MRKRPAERTALWARLGSRPGSAVVRRCRRGATTWAGRCPVPTQGWTRAPVRTPGRHCAEHGQRPGHDTARAAGIGAQPVGALRSGICSPRHGRSGCWSKAPACSPGGCHRGRGRPSSRPSGKPGGRPGGRPGGCRASGGFTHGDAQPSHSVASLLQALFVCGLDDRHELRGRQQPTELALPASALALLASALNHLLSLAALKSSPWRFSRGRRILP